jgi:hypothetical protein
VFFYFLVYTVSKRTISGKRRIGILNARTARPEDYDSEKPSASSTRPLLTKRGREHKKNSTDEYSTDEGSSPTARRKPMPKKKRIQRTWSKKETEAVMRHLEKMILRKQVPKKTEILLCMEAERSLSTRTWQNIRDFCRNRIVWAPNA